jgi:hypothetical protein
VCDRQGEPGSGSPLFYIHLALLNSSIEAGILLCGNGALPRHGGRALSRACVTQLSALSSGCFSYTGSHSLLLLT